MELTREALRAVEFRSRGQWYQARQVDQFIEELTVAVDQAQRERDTLRQKLEEARSQSQELAARAAALEEEAVSALALAKTAHDELEALYNPHVDFDGVYQTADALAAELLSLPPLP